MLLMHAHSVITGLESQFGVVSSREATTQGVPYDFESVMHYSAYAFSRNDRPTIVPKDNSIPLSFLGQRNGFTERDIQHARALYCGEFEITAFGLVVYVTMTMMIWQLHAYFKSNMHYLIYSYFFPMQKQPALPLGVTGGLGHLAAGHAMGVQGAGLEHVWGALDVQGQTPRSRVAIPTPAVSIV